ncbi:MAG: hypothetical protein IPM54_13430 [Polyangiaceae bacterium]|nr:hypothetical protein [Polyangiaceae bacterium]
MKPDLISAVLRRGGYRCAWCACALNTGRTADTGTVCKLDVFDGPTSVVASCIACAAEYSRWWDHSRAYTIENAKRILGRANALASGPFVDYLENICGPMVIRSGSKSGKRSGLLTPFTTALARIEAQRNAPLDLRRKGRAA